MGRRAIPARSPSGDTAGPGRDAPIPHALGLRSMLSDTQTDMLLGEPKSAICVQRFDDSLNSAIHTTYRSWLRSSSIREPRDPPLKVVSLFFFFFPLQPAGSRQGNVSDRYVEVRQT